MNPTTVGELKKILANVADDRPILVSHSGGCTYFSVDKEGEGEIDIDGKSAFVIGVGKPACTLPVFTIGKQCLKPGRWYE